MPDSTTITSCNCTAQCPDCGACCQRACCHRRVWPGAEGQTFYSTSTGPAVLSIHFHEPVDPTHVEPSEKPILPLWVAQAFLGVLVLAFIVAVIA